MTDRPVREARNAMPSMANMKYWGDPTDKTRGLTIGIEIARHNAPKIAPTSELIRAAPRARPASPFFAMGWPSTTMEAVMGSPGTPKRIEVMSPVVAVTAVIPRRKEKASTGVIVENKRKHQGQSDRPAKARQDSHHEADANPRQLENEGLPGKELDQALRQASRISTIAEFQRARGNRRAPAEDGPLAAVTFFSDPRVSKALSIWT